MSGNHSGIICWVSLRIFIRINDCFRSSPQPTCLARALSGERLSGEESAGEGGDADGPGDDAGESDGVESDGGEPDGEFSGDIKPGIEGDF